MFRENFEFKSTVSCNGETMSLQKEGNESVEHWLLKTTMISYLFVAGFKSTEIELEKRFEKQRADIFVQNKEQQVWIECKDYDNDRHHQIRKHYDGKLIRVLELEGFRRAWNYIIEQKKFEKNVNKRIVQHRLVPRDCAVWGMHLGQDPKIIFGISRNKYDEFTFIKNWDISDYGPRKDDKIIDITPRIKENKNSDVLQKKIQSLFGL